jgi:hypothetical protein
VALKLITVPLIAQVATLTAIVLSKVETIFTDFSVPESELVRFTLIVFNPEGIIFADWMTITGV